MTDSNENNNQIVTASTEEVIAAQNKKDILNLSKITSERLNHENDKRKLESELATALAANTEIYDQKEKLRLEKIKKEAEVEALRSDLLRQKTQSALSSSEQYQTESEILGLKALAIVKKRYADRYGYEI